MTSYMTSTPVDQRFSFDNFVVGKPNEFAFHAIKSIARVDEPSKISNLLFMRGGVGLGKTHLMHAAVGHIRAYYPHRKVIYLSAEKFMHYFITALREKNLLEFKDGFRSADVLMIDDVQFLSGKEGTQEEFFHTFNDLIEAGKQLVISADRPPSELKDIEERIKSRLSWGLVVDVNPTNYELRLGILESKIKHFKMDISVDHEILEFLAASITSNVRELEGSLNKLISSVCYSGKKLSLQLAQELLTDIVKPNKQVDIQTIQEMVAKHFQITVENILSNARTKVMIIPRQIAMFLSKTLTTKSLPEIGRCFGGKDHTTILYAIRRVERLRHTDSSIGDHIKIITDKIYK